MLYYKNYPVMYRHIRHPFNPSRLIGTICCLYSNDTVHIGFSQCHPNDQFSKAIGREIAAEMCYRGNNKREVPFVVYRPNGSKSPTYLISKNIPILLSRAKRIWSPTDVRNNLIPHTSEAPKCQAQ